MSTLSWSSGIPVPTVDSLPARLSTASQYTADLPSSVSTSAVPASAEALPSAGTHCTPPFDVLLLDIQMRRMNGDEVCRRLRTLGLSLAIVATTGTSACVLGAVVLWSILKFP